MSFDKPTRNLLAGTVARCRDRLSDDIINQLQSTYGLHPDGTTLDVARTEDQRRAAEDLRALLAHFQTTEAGRARARQAAAYGRLVREIGFTTLNRLAALRLCEERGLVVECVRRGMASDGFQLYDRIAGGALGDRYQTYRAFLESLFDELALDLGALFDRGAPQSLIFPGEAALSDVLTLLTDPQLAARDVWQQDETIGWIYQYYNDSQERKAMRDASQAPRNSRELAVRNQFFTPRYVVEFLTDNTLGRTWYEMRQGDTRLAATCRYLVRRPNEIFLAPGEYPIPNTQYPIPHRPLKDPRDLKILDPACGSGHFLLYAFDLLLIIYEEAWNATVPPFSETGTQLAGDYSDLASLRAAAPGLILRHNLHGVDIDPRAAQIAALALWLRAQRAYQALNLSPTQRPRITRTHVVTAEPMPGDEELLGEFLRDLRPRVLGDLVRVVFEKMKLAGEAGSLLKIEEELSEAITAARSQWAREPQAEQLALFQDRHPGPEQLPLFDVSGISDEAFWETAEERVLRALRDYATRVENGKGTRRRLFVEDVAQGFAFVDLCRQRFDVVLMNPPFGETTGQSARYFKSIYPNSKSDLATMFVERVSGLLKDTGVQGAITTRNPFLLSISQRWREKVIFDSGSLWVFADLGMGVMDAAAVEAASYVLGRQKVQRQSVFVRLLLEEDKMSVLNQSMLKLQQGQQSSRVFFVDPAEFLKVPGATLCYWASASMRKAFHTLEKLGDIASVEMGMSTKDNFRFLRCLWEVPSSRIGFENVWAPYAKGGESSPFSFVHDTLVLADNDFAQLKAELTRKYPYLQGNTDWVLHPEYSYGQPGLTYGRLVRRFSANPLPASFYFSESSSAIFPENQDNLLALMSLLSSDAVRGFLGMVTAVRKMEAGYIASIPVPSLDQSTHKVLSDLALQAYHVQLARNSVNELSAYFVAPPFSEFGQSQPQNATSLADILDRIEQAAFSAYQMNDDDRKLVQREMKAITGLTTTFRSKDIQDPQSTSTHRHKSFGSLDSQRTAGIGPIERFGHRAVEVSDKLENTPQQIVK